MTTRLLSLSITVMICLSLHAQAVLFFDDFESYTVGSYLAQSSSNWLTWQNMPGTTEDAFISDEQANSGSNSVKLESLTGAGPTDILLPLGGLTTGNYAVSLDMYVVSGNGGYFNLQHYEAPGVEWALEVYFDNGGTGSINANGTGAANFIYSQDTWVPVVVNVDLDNVTASLVVGTTLVHTWPFNTQADGSGPGANQLGGLNIYAAASGTGNPALFYVDDVQLTQTNVGIDEASALSDLVVAPIPANDLLTITGELSAQTRFRVVDLTGKQIDVRVDRGMNELTRLNVAHIVPGVYFLEVTEGKERVVTRFVKE